MSEKPMTELFLKSGLVAKHIAELERWRLIDPSSTEGLTPTKSARDVLLDIVEDISSILEEEPIIKQTLFTPLPKGISRWNVGGVKFQANVDELGRLIIAPRLTIWPGELIYREGEEVGYTVLQTEEIYENDKVSAQMLIVEKNA